MLHKKRRLVKLLFGVVLLCFFPVVSVRAEGNINGNEAAVLAALDGEFTYDGSVYKVDPSYKASLRSYFAKEGVDLTESQKNACLGKITANIGMAVKEGYLVKVGSVQETESTKTDTTSTKKTKQEKKTEKNTKKKTTKEETAEQTEKKTEKETEKNTEKNEAEKETEEKTEKQGSERGQSESETSESEVGNDRIADGKQTSGGMEKQTGNIREENRISGTDRENTDQVILFLGVGIVTVLLTVLFLCRKRRKRPLLCECTYTDIHCHILPGVDDGAKDMEETLAMLCKAKEQGIQTLIATPHYAAGKKKVSPERLEEIRQQVQQRAEQEGIDVEILLGSELYYSKDICQRLEEKKALTMAGTRYVLVEFSPNETYTEVYQGLHELVQGGYIPILAHMERYRCLHKEKAKIRELIELGAYMQMNVESLRSRYCKKLVKDGLIHFFGSDSHHVKHRPPRMQDGIGWLGNRLTKDQLEKIFLENPERLRENKYIRRGKKGL